MSDGGPAGRSSGAEAEITSLDRYLAALEAELGPVPQDEAEAAAAWAAAAFDEPEPAR